MTPADWIKVHPIFNVRENWGDPYGVKKGLVFGLYEVRKYTGHSMHIHCAMEKRAKFSWHGDGSAADVHISGLSLIDQWLAFERFDCFNGLGLYPWWNNPGIHADVRPKEMRLQKDARWISTGPGVYVPLNRENLLRHCQIF